MNFSIIVLFIMILFLFITMMKSIMIIKENERGVIFRLGKYFRILGPGLHILAPYVDKLDKLNLNEEIQNWQSLSDDELKEKVKTIIIYKQK